MESNDKLNLKLTRGKLFFESYIISTEDDSKSDDLRSKSSGAGLSIDESENFYLFFKSFPQLLAWYKINMDAVNLDFIKEFMDYKSYDRSKFQVKFK